jgi:hypothetical protein
MGETNYPRGTVLGPFVKEFTTGWFGWQVFDPKTVPGTDIPILCNCRKINEYIMSRNGDRYLNARAALLFGKYPPTCWDDTTSIFKQTDPNYSVTIGHPIFYQYQLNKNGSVGIAKNLLAGKESGLTVLGFKVPWLGGKRTRKAKRNPAKRKRRRNTIRDL